jgi:ABC-type transport system involved in multi-copper enzyme maturation permease subunit
MKLLAILKDSLLESLDSRVIYVMAGLSLLLIGISATMTFTPKPGGEMVMRIASTPLAIDLKNIDPLRRGGGPNPLEILANQLGGAIQMESASPAPGEEDRPGSTFVVTLKRAGLIPQKPEETAAQIQEKFGLLDDVRVAEVVSAAHEGGKFIVTARLTQAGKNIWPHDFALFFGALPLFQQGVPLGIQLYGLQNILVNQVGAWAALIISIIMTAFFVPNMLRKGTIDLLLVKPISRPALLLYKYLGGLTFIALNTALAVGGLWLVLGIRSGVWAPAPLLAIPAITFFFAILYSLSVLAGVVTRSAVVSILVTCLMWFFLFCVGATVGILDTLDRVETARARGQFPPPPGMPPPVIEDVEAEGPLERPYSNSTFGRIVRGLHFILPRTNDLNTLLSDQLQRDLMTLPRALRAAAFRADPVSWGESVAVSLAFITVMLGLACWWFSTRDY